MCYWRSFKVHTSCLLLGCMVVNIIRTLINIVSMYTVTKLKMVSLYDFMLDPFKHKGYCVVMDSAYMRDAMCQVGREEWKINMVGTCQTDHNVVPALLGRLLLLARISRLLLTVMSLSSFSTRPSHWPRLFGETTTLWGPFLISIS